MLDRNAAARPAPDVTRDPLGDDALLFIGNATVLLRYAGFTILTDPNFVHRGEDVPLGYGLSTRRLTDPAVEIDDLPPLDLVVLSHLHADHFDRIAEARLPRSIPIVTTHEAAHWLAERGFRSLEPLVAWEMHELRTPTGRLRITAMPGRHAPGVLDLAMPEVIGTYYEFWDGVAMATRGATATLRVYVSGDTLMYEGLREIPDRMPAIDLALVHLGGTRVMGVTVTMDGEQGRELVETLRPKLTVPIHVDDYEAFKSPLSAFLDEIDRVGLRDRVRTLRRGDVLRLPVDDQAPAT